MKNVQFRIHLLAVCQYALDNIGQLLIPRKCGTTGNLDDGFAANIHIRDLFRYLKAQDVPSVCVLAAARVVSTGQILYEKRIVK